VSPLLEIYERMIKYIIDDKGDIIFKCKDATISGKTPKRKPKEHSDDETDYDSEEMETRYFYPLLLNRIASLPPKRVEELEQIGAVSSRHYLFPGKGRGCQGPKDLAWTKTISEDDFEDQREDTGSEHLWTDIVFCEGITHDKRRIKDKQLLKTLESDWTPEKLQSQKFNLKNIDEPASFITLHELFHSAAFNPPWKKQGE